jgi:hypothetical protein
MNLLDIRCNILKADTASARFMNKALETIQGLYCFCGFKTPLTGGLKPDRPPAVLRSLVVLHAPTANRVLFHGIENNVFYKQADQNDHEQAGKHAGNFQHVLVLVNEPPQATGT